MYSLNISEFLSMFLLDGLQPQTAQPLNQTQEKNKHEKIWINIQKAIRK